MPARLQLLQRIVCNLASEQHFQLRLGGVVQAVLAREREGQLPTRHQPQQNVAYKKMLVPPAQCRRRDAR